MDKLRAPWAAACAAAIVVASACGSGDDAGSRSSGGTGGDDGATGGDDGGIGGDDSGSFGDAYNPDAFAGCATDTEKAKQLPLDLYFMLDTSGSMDDLVAQQTSKWSEVVKAMTAFVNDPASIGIGVGVQHFALPKSGVPASCTSSSQCNGSGPCLLQICNKGQGVIPCDSSTPCPKGAMCVTVGECQYDHDVLCFGPGITQCGNDPNGFSLGACQSISSSFCVAGDSCSAGDYATPAVAIAPLPGVAGAVVSAMQSWAPQGNTPTSAALQGAIDGAQSFAKANAGHTVVTVLATDGIPDECNPTSISGIAAIAQAGVSGNPSVRTFVIGVFTPQDKASATTALNQIASAGGSGQAFMVDTSQNVEQQFVSALNAIRGSSLPCEYTLPTPDGGIPDYGKVNVQFTSGSGKVTIVPYVGSAANCDPNVGGWYYDVDPNQGTPTKVIVCPATCAMLEGDPKGQVDVVLGCKTIVK